jgi:hypothetical protein
MAGKTVGLERCKCHKLASALPTQGEQALLSDAKNPLDSVGVNTPPLPLHAPKVAANMPDSGEIGGGVRTSFKYVGHGRRWYDPAYNLLRFLQYSWFGRRLPASWRRRVYYMSNYLVQLNEVERMVTEGGHTWDEPLNLPDDEHVAIPGIWVVDYFPPSLIDVLDKAIKTNRWDNRPHVGIDQSNAETLRASRRGSGTSWWRIADISSTGADSWFSTGYREKLPKEFTSIELKGIPIGEGLTAVIAYFHLSKWGSSLVDEIWHTVHPPSLARTKGHLVVAEGEKWAAFRQTQRTREGLHEVARNWMQLHCPGAFGKAKEHQPLMDLLLLDLFDPSTGEQPDRETEDWMRALGLTESGVFWRTSTDLPGFLLEQARQVLAPGIRKRTWALWGNMTTAITQGANLRGYDTGISSALAHYVDRRMEDLIVRLGLSDFLELLKSDSAIVRDSTRAHHRRFGRSDLKRLRQRFLTASLDFSSIERDVKQYNNRRWRDREPSFTLDYTPWIRRQDEEAGRTPFEPIRVNIELRKQQNKAARTLVSFDHSYREILATVASLGASIDAFKVQRLAIWIAISSAAVAFATLWVSLLSSGEAVKLIVEWQSWASR